MASFWFRLVVVPLHVATNLNESRIANVSAVFNGVIDVHHELCQQVSVVLSMRLHVRESLTRPIASTSPHNSKHVIIRK